MVRLLLLVAVPGVIRRTDWYYSAQLLNGPVFITLFLHGNEEDGGGIMYLLSNDSHRSGIYRNKAHV